MNYIDNKDAIILLEDGTIFYGKSISTQDTATGEICFNTGMTGYQEIFTDPSYTGQLMITTNAHIGNYGITSSDSESSQVRISGLICKNFSYNYSRPSANESLLSYLSKYNLCIISHVDTRALVRHIRDNGVQNAIISTNVNDIDSLKQQLNQVPSMQGLELVSQVSCAQPYYYGNPDAKIKIAALDLGIKTNILKHLADRDCYIKIFPYNTPFHKLQEFQPDGYFLSNGPGDPEPLKHSIQTARDIINDNKPLFGICLGHQVIAQAMGISTYKMHNGHRGINHPVLNIETGKGEITSQNHGFAINKEQTQQHPDVHITHIHLNDNTVAGIRIKNKPCFSVQYHPEAGPGPNDATYLFDQFITLITNNQK